MHENIRCSRLNGWLLRGVLQARNPVSRILFRKARDVAQRLRNKAVAYRIGSIEVALPANHPLPIYQQRYPYYDTALPRLVRTMAAGSESFVVADIGANIGDTAAALLAITQVRLIAIDGNQQFVPYLRHNLRDQGDRTTIVEKFVGPPAMDGFSVDSAFGTAHLIQYGDGEQVSLTSLEAIRQSADVQRFDLIKIDTDGFDIAILRDSADILATGSAALFFEFDPKLFRHITPDGWKIFDELRKFGYVFGLAYLNTGTFLRSFQLAEPNLVEELGACLGSADDTAYFDLAMFKSESQFEACRNAEMTALFRPTN